LTPFPQPAQNWRLPAARHHLASVVVAGRFLPIWLATGVLLVVATIIAPRALQNTSWAYVLPYMTVLAVVALGQMLVVMHAGIDLSTPGVMSFG
jgi:ribose/xylose/arabinose/galactoside ABC-type transport system permease subunit